MLRNTATAPERFVGSAARERPWRRAPARQA